MWFIFPQLEGLGTSATTMRYSIKSREEAVAYLAHPLLGPRLLECCRTVLGIDGRTANDIFGWPDDRKLQSCATLFARTSDELVFQALLDKYFDGRLDHATVELLQGLQR
jgi:uncharacterized protein (DUF1810 family)